MSAGFSSRGDVEDGDGERTTDGMRACPRFGLDENSVPSGVVIVTIGVNDGEDSGFRVDSEVDIATGGAGAGVLGSQVTPGFRSKFNVSPSLTAYS